MSDQVMTPPVPKKKSVQLSGVVAGSTAISAVGSNGKDLRYRGYDINDLAHYSTFEEVAYLLIHGEMPNHLQFSRYKAQTESHARPAGAGESRARTDPGGGPSHGRAAHRLLHAGHGPARERRHEHRRGAPHRRPAAGDLPLHAAVLVPLRPQREADRPGYRRGFDCRPLPAPAARRKNPYRPMSTPWMCP